MTTTTTTKPSDPLRTPGGTSSGQLSRRAQRVVAALLEEQRWPDRDRLPRLLAPLVGKVLTEHPTTKPDRAAAMKVTAAAATYCWSFLPKPDWTRLPVPPADGQPPLLLWHNRQGTVIADLLLAGQHRDLDRAGRRLAAELLDHLSVHDLEPDALRLLPLSAPARALLFTPDEPDVPLAISPLTTTKFAAIGGLWP